MIKISLLSLVVLSAAVLEINAQEFNSLNNNMNALKDVKQQIKTLESKVETLETYITKVEACAGQTPPKHFNGSSCVTITERDPNIKTHGKSGLSGTICTEQNKAQYFDGSAWGCKTFN